MIGLWFPMLVFASFWDWLWKQFWVVLASTFDAPGVNNIAKILPNIDAGIGIETRRLRGRPPRNSSQGLWLGPHEARWTSSPPGAVYSIASPLLFFPLLSCCFLFFHLLFLSLPCLSFTRSFILVRFSDSFHCPPFSIHFSDIGFAYILHNLWNR